MSKKESNPPPPKNGKPPPPPPPPQVGRKYCDDICEKSDRALCTCNMPSAQEQIARLQRELDELRGDLAEKRSLMDLQHRRTLEAQRLWQTETGNTHWPDLGTLIEWLTERGNREEGELDTLHGAATEALVYLTDLTACNALDRERLGLIKSANDLRQKLEEALELEIVTKNTETT